MKFWRTEDEWYPCYSLEPKNDVGGKFVEVSYEFWIDHMIVSNLFEEDQFRLGRLDTKDAG